LRRLHVAAFAARHVSIASGLKKAGARRIMKKGSGLAAEFSVYPEPGDGCKSNRRFAPYFQPFCLQVIDRERRGR
jgi:hypothetical protein